MVQRDLGASYQQLTNELRYFLPLNRFRAHGGAQCRFLQARRLWLQIERSIATNWRTWSPLKSHTYWPSSYECSRRTIHAMKQISCQKKRSYSFIDAVNFINLNINYFSFSWNLKSKIIAQFNSDSMSIFQKKRMNRVWLFQFLVFICLKIILADEIFFFEVSRLQLRFFIDHFVFVGVFVCGNRSFKVGVLRYTGWDNSH